jgi:hypothetical protein
VLFGQRPVVTIGRASAHSPRLTMAQQLRQLRHVSGDPSCLVFGEKFRRRPPARLFFEVDIGELLPTAVLHDEAGVVEFFNRPGRGEASIARAMSRSIWWSTGARTRASATALRATRRRTSTGRRDHAVNRPISRDDTMMLCRRRCREDNAKNDGDGKRNFRLARHTLHLRLVPKVRH